jgi:hypothetical protein
MSKKAKISKLASWMLLEWKKNVSGNKNKQAHFLITVGMERGCLKKRKSTSSLSDYCWNGKRKSQKAEINRLTF